MQPLLQLVLLTLAAAGPVAETLTAVLCSTLQPPFCNCTGGAGNARNCSCSSCGACDGCSTCQICDGPPVPTPPTPPPPAPTKNGMAMTPPLTWRSWNQMGWYITDAVLLQATRGLVDGSRPIKGMPAGSSLKDLGFGEVGMDEGWAACPPCTGGPGAPHADANHGRNSTVDPRAAMRRQQVAAQGFPLGGGRFSQYHRLDNATGLISPVVDEFAFPDMKRLVDQIHAMGLRAGWYLNDCLSYCAQIRDPCPAAQCVPGDVAAFAAYGFDSLKIDGCSAQKGVDRWAALINDTAAGPRVRIENCNNSPRPEAGPAPLAERCPWYHTYRTGRDINNAYSSWIFNAQEFGSYAATGRSGPGCVRACVVSAAAAGRPSHPPARSPPSLPPSLSPPPQWGYPDMLMVGVQGQTPDESVTGKYGPWAGGFVQPSVREQRTHFGLWCALSAPLTLSMDFGNTSAVDAVWHIVTNTHALAVNQAWGGEHGGEFARAAVNVSLRADCVPNTACDDFGKGAKVNIVVPSWQAWYKPLSANGTAAAIFVANHADTPQDISLLFADVPGLAGGPFTVIDVWAQAQMAGTHTSFEAKALGRRDSAFITVAPA